MIKYVFDDSVPLAIKNGKDANPQALGEALEVISATHGGRLKPEDVVKAAKDPSSPLHHHIEWRDDVAAAAYRLDQARAIIRIVRVAPIDNNPPQRAFISVGDSDGRSYRAIAEVASSASLQARLAAQADRELIAFVRRFRSLTELCGEIDKLRERLLKATIDDQRPAA